MCPVKKFNIGLFGGQTVGRVVLCNAQTGECVDYAVEDVQIDSADAGYIFIMSGWGGEAYSQRNLADDVYDGVFVDFEVTQNTGAKEEIVLYDDKLHGLDWFMWKAKHIWTAVLNWFINTF